MFRRIGLFAASRWVIVPAALGFMAANVPAQIQEQDRQRARQMLVQAKKDLHKYYYDSTFGGWNIEAAYARADSAIQSAPSPNHAFAMVADFMSQLNDSHTKFYPPRIAASVNYGFGMQAFGDSVRITSVVEKSDAEAKGLRVGDRVVTWDRMRVNRKALPLIRYVYLSLSPRPLIRLTIERDGEAAPRTLDIAARIKKRQTTVDETDIDVQRDIIAGWEDASRAARHFFRAYGDSVIVWRMPSFIGGDETGIDEMMKDVRKRRAVVLDLRNNGGGAVSTLEYLIGKFFNRDVPYLVWSERGKDSLYVAKPSDKDPYLGLMVILINSNSASASEVFSSALQREGRAIVVGDRSMGAVVVSRTFGHEVGFGRVYDFSNQISVADMRTPEGQRLEGVGVTPDHVIVPTPEDLCKRRDPQLAKALSLVGVTVTAEEAGRLFWGEKMRKYAAERLGKNACL